VNFLPVPAGSVFEPPALEPYTVKPLQLLSPSLWEQNNLWSQPANNSSVAEDEQRQRQNVVDEETEESNALLHGVARIDTERSAPSLHYIRRHSGQRYLNCWNIIAYNIGII